MPKESGTILSDMPPGPMKIKKKSYSTDVLYQISHLTPGFITHGCCFVVNATYMPAGLVRLHVRRRLVAADAANMPADLVQLSQAPLLFKHVYWLMVVCCSCNKHACWLSATPGGRYSDMFVYV